MAEILVIDRIDDTVEVTGAGTGRFIVYVNPGHRECHFEVNSENVDAMIERLQRISQTLKSGEPRGE